MNATTGSASPLPEGRADGRVTVERCGSCLKRRGHASDCPAAPVVAVPGNEAGASSPDLAADAPRPEAGEREVEKALQQRDDAEDWADRLAAAIEASTGIAVGEHSSANNPWQNALDALDAAPAVPVGVQPEPAEEHRGSCRIFYAENRCTCRAGPAVPAEALHNHGGHSGLFLQAAEDLAPVVAAAVAAVRADRDRLAGQVAAIRALCDEAVDYELQWIQTGMRPSLAATILAALVASSPTTPEADS